MRILVTGAAGFINGYLVPELLAGHEVIGVDDFGSYGATAQAYDSHPRYRFVQGDAKDAALMRELAADCDQVVAAAAMIGGISYFHEFAYDLLAENERILASTFDAAIAAEIARPPPAGRRGQLVDGVRVGDRLPDAGGRPADLAPAGLDLRLPEARLGVLRHGAWEQFQLPYTIVRPFNCVGIGERRRGSPAMSGRQAGLDTSSRTWSSRCSRARTRSTSWARATRSATTRGGTWPTGSGSRWSRRTRSTTTSTSAGQGDHDPRAGGGDLAQGPTGDEFRYVTDPPFEHDVRSACPTSARRATSWASEATTALDAMLDEVIPWVRDEMETGVLTPKTRA